MKTPDPKYALMSSPDSPEVRQEFAEALAQVFERHLRLHPLTILDQLLVSVAGLCIAHTVNVESAIEVLRECHRRTLQRDLESAVDPKELS
jgi:hypothetical protein